MTLAGLPDKVTAAPAIIPADATAVQVKVTAAADAEGTEKPFQVVAVAGPRTARSEAKLTVPVQASLALLPVADVTVKAGEDAVVEIKVERKNFKGPIRVTFEGLPDKVTAAPAAIGESENAVKVKLSSAADAAEAERKPLRVVASADQLRAESDLRLTVQKSDAFQPQTLWVGQRFFASGEVQGVELKVTRRVGSKFDGAMTLSWPGGSATHSVAGEINKGRVSFQSEKNGNFHQRFDGEIKDGVMTCQWNGVSAKGRQVSGTANLRLKKN